MAKKFVRGITDIKKINNQDFDTNNVNDLLSDGKHNYIHRKKGKKEEYHNLTNNLKTISSSNTDLLTVINDNDTDNSATLHPKHDVQKEQSLESTRSTITIAHGANSTTETTKVDTNPTKVLEHENLITDYGISKTTSGNTTTLGLEYTKVIDGFDLNSLTSGSVRGNNLKNAPRTGWYFVDTFGDENNTIQNAKELLAPNTSFIRSRENGVWGQWREQVGDKSAIDGLLAQKQNKVVNNSSIGVLHDSLQQLFTWYEEYNHDNGFMKTHTIEMANNVNVYYVREKFNFTVKVNKGATSATFTLNEHDKTKFSNIITTYGVENAVRISGCTFTLSGSTLTVTTANNVDNNYVITFSDII